MAGRGGVGDSAGVLTGEQHAKFCALGQYCSSHHRLKKRSGSTRELRKVVYNDALRLTKRRIKRFLSLVPKRRVGGGRS